MGKVRSVLKRAVVKLLNKAGYDLIDLRPSTFDFIRYYQVDTVLDIGANIGQFGAKLRKSGFDGKIISFEPQRRIYEQLLENTRNDHRWSCFNIAAGATNRKAAINLLESGGTLSTLLKPYPVMGSAYATEEVKVVRLDSVLPEVCDEQCRAFLKIDTEGFEAEVLDGLGTMHRRFIGISLELAMIPMYERQAPFGEMITRMETIGFRTALIEPICYWHQQKLLMNADCVFLRDDLLFPDAYSFEK